MTETFIKERKHNLTGKVEKVGIDDASLFLARFEQRLAGDVRGDPLRARPQGALHPGNQRRERLDRSGTCTTCTACSISITATRAGCAAGAPSTSPTATIPTWSTGGCRACRSATSTPSSTRSPISSRPPAKRQGAAADLPRGLATDYVTDAVLKSAKTRAVGDGREVRSNPSPSPRTRPEGESLQEEILAFVTLRGAWSGWELTSRFRTAASRPS